MLTFRSLEDTEKDALIPRLYAELLWRRDGRVTVDNIAYTDAMEWFHIRLCMIASEHYGHIVTFHLHDVAKYLITARKASKMPTSKLVQSIKDEVLINTGAYAWNDAYWGDLIQPRIKK